MHRWTGLALALAFVSLPAALPADESPAVPDVPGAEPKPAVVELPAGDADPVAIINGHPITKAEFVQRLAEWHGPSVLDEMITRALVDQETKRHGVTNSAEEVNQRVDLQVKLAEEKVRQESGGQVKLAEVLQQKGETVEGFRNLLIHNDNFQKQIVLEKLVQYSILTEEMVEVQHLVVENEAKAREALDKIRKGADFAKIAQEMSEDTLSGAQGGKMHPFILGLSPMGIQFDEIAFKLKDGETSDVVRTGRGFHIVRKLSTRAATPKTYTELRENVWKCLETQPIHKRVLMAWLYRLRYLHRDKTDVKLKWK